MAPRIPALPTEGRDPKTAELLDSFKGFNGTELSYLCRAPYEWGQHVAIGLAAGLTHEEIARVAGGPDASGWSDADALLLRTTDELAGRKVLVVGRARKPLTTRRTDGQRPCDRRRRWSRRGHGRVR